MDRGAWFPSITDRLRYAPDERAVNEKPWRRDRADSRGTAARAERFRRRNLVDAGPDGGVCPSPVPEGSTTASLRSIGALARHAGPVAHHASNLARFALARATG